MSVNIPSELDKELRTLAKRSDLKIGEYLRCLYLLAVANEITIPGAAKPFANNKIIRHELESKFITFKARDLQDDLASIAMRKATNSGGASKLKVKSKLTESDAVDDSNRPSPEPSEEAP